VEVPYDPQALQAALKGMGLDGCDIVQQANLMPSSFHAGGYGNIIHEMSEMAVNCWGQWELNNQPVWAMQHMQVAFDSAVNGRCARQAQPPRAASRAAAVPRRPAAAAAPRLAGRGGTPTPAAALV
jgi:hypothetical protein